MMDIGKDLQDAFMDGYNYRDAEIVRCKDCIHYKDGFECMIEGYGSVRDKDWYCADGERKEE